MYDASYVTTSRAASCHAGHVSPYLQGAFWQQENTSLTDLLGISMNTMRYYVRSNQYNGMRQSYIHLFLFMTRKNHQGRSNIIAVRCC